MSSFECKVSDLSEKPEEKIEQNVTPSIELLSEIPIEDTKTSSDKTIYNINITNIKKIIIILVVYLLINSEIVTNIIVNNFSFMESQSGGLNIYGLLFTFFILVSTYFISS